MPLVDVKWMRYAARMSSAVLTKVALIAGGYFAGNWADGELGTGPWLMVGGIAVGTGIGLFWVIYVADKFQPK